jgi:hypothetical protein
MSKRMFNKKQTKRLIVAFGAMTIAALFVVFQG